MEDKDINMISNPKTVYILGAGFTRAFYEAAPLLIGEFLKDDSKFENLECAYRILKLERKRNSDKNIDIESLMTRLYNLMPYDSEGQTKELNLLLFEIKKSFIDKLEDAKSGKNYEKDLLNFAKYCVEKSIDCITFNNDDFFDKMLMKVKKVHIQDKNKKIEYWHPDGGYGFFCRPSVSLIARPNRSMDVTAMLLLKLHGSINWRIKQGYSSPYNIDAIVHNDLWSLDDKILSPEDIKNINGHLEEQPFIIPPILAKSAFVEQPILKVIWSKAYQILKMAEQVTFIGYSFPITDFAVCSLFKETINDGCNISIVDFREGEKRKELIMAYQKVFPNIVEDNFDFGGALEWSRKMR
jgi:hypothetical protein